MNDDAFYEDDFYEDDEPVEKILAAFERGEKRVTVSPEPVTGVVLGASRWTTTGNRVVTRAGVDVA